MHQRRTSRGVGKIILKSIFFLFVNVEYIYLHICHLSFQNLSSTLHIFTYALKISFFCIFEETHCALRERDGEHSKLCGTITPLRSTGNLNGVSCSIILVSKDDKTLVANLTSLTSIENQF